MQIVINLKIFIFIIIFFFTKQIELYVVVMIFAIIHELSHCVCGLILKLKPEKVILNPLGLSILFHTNIEDYNKQYFNAPKIILKKLFVAMAGPLINLVIAIVFIKHNFEVFHIKKEMIVYSNLLLLFFNLIPIYPLDGGRILKCLIHILKGKKVSESLIYKINNIILCIITALASGFIYYYKNIAILFIIIFLWILVIKENKKYQVKERIYNIIKNQDNK